MRLRSSEWILIAYFCYVALVSRFFPLQHPLLPFAVIILTGTLLLVLALGEAYVDPVGFNVARDWVPLGLTLIAYREMDWFTPLVRDRHLELRWIEWDRTILPGLQHVIESVGWLGPGYFELCYLLVYAVGPFAVWMLYLEQRREQANKLLVIYLVGTLLAYAMFPYFPSDPPRVVFGATDMPHLMTALRRVNLWMVGGYGIHSSVFPSAHVSSAFSAAWALLLLLPNRRAYGWGMLLYAASVAVATVYGRYHYGVDALAGFGVSLVAGAIGYWRRNG